MLLPLLRSRGRTALVVLSILGLFFCCAGCKKKNKSKKKSGPTTVKYNWKKKWDKITADGEEGKFHVRQGLTIVRDAPDPEGRDKGYKQMVEGINLLLKGLARGEDLLDTVHEKEPGRSFPEWEDTLSKWGETASKARKSLPLDYIDMVNK
ncbi:MAG: hypothetical protein ACYTFG_15780 [Planctomycetota bacterium]|jgi:hypothetical protein